MPNKDVFCNSPWYELHIFWDGSFGYCCAQTPHRPYSNEFSEFYNIKNMSISDWHNSPPMRSARLGMNTDIKLNECNACWYQEEFSPTSRRHKANIKSVIFKQEFDESFIQSPNFPIFNESFTMDGFTEQMPIDLHIDLGNYCNLACKFCCPEASSKIASQYRKWNITSDSDPIANDWAKDTIVWERFLTQLLEIDNLQNIHFMGGETLLTPRFGELIDELIKYERYDVCLSFVTNGTIFDSALMGKLSKFKRVGTEISIESMTIHNEYLRQGTINDDVVSNIFKYIELSLSTSFEIAIRPAVSSLSIGYYHTLLKFCLDHKLIVKSSNVIGKVGWNSSRCMDARILPQYVKDIYKIHYVDLLGNIDDDRTNTDFNESDPTNYMTVIRNECIKCIALLDSELEHDLYPDLVELLKKWDKVYDLNAIDLYPELSELLLEYNYNVD